MTAVICIFLLGLIIGSFLNAVIWRLHTGRSIAASSSECPHCHHKLSWPDLIPLVSFFILGRRCRYCKKPISWQYPAVELTTALGFALIYKSSSIPAEAGIQSLFFCLLIIIFVYDLRHYLILDKVVFPAAVLALGYQVYMGNTQAALLGAAVLSGFFALLYAVSRGRWIGLGDVKLGIFLGLLVPFPQTLALFFLAYLFGAAVSVTLLIWGGKHLSSRLPFGTFLTFAAFVAMLWGEEIMLWYFRLIGISL